MNKYEFFKIMELPFDAYEYFIKREFDFKVFTPKTMDEDLSQGTISALVYYYPIYLSELYDLVSRGEDYRSFFRKYTPSLEILFKQMFRTTSSKLDRILGRKIKVNYLAEIKVRL